MDLQFAVFVREEHQSPDLAETKVAEYPTYGEARRLGKELGQSGQQCIIRSTGQTGGSD